MYIRFQFLLMQVMNKHLLEPSMRLTAFTDLAALDGLTVAELACPVHAPDAVAA